MEKKNILTIEDVALELGVSTQTVRGLIKRGELKHFRVGKLIRITRNDLDDYINKHKR